MSWPRIASAWRERPVEPDRVGVGERSLDPEADELGPLHHGLAAEHPGHHRPHVLLAVAPRLHRDEGVDQEAAVGVDGGGRAVQPERAHPVRVAQGQLLGDHPAHRGAADVGAADPERVQQARHVGGHAGDGVGRGRHVALAGAAVVERDHAMLGCEGGRLQRPRGVVPAPAHDEHERRARRARRSPGRRGGRRWPGRGARRSGNDGGEELVELGLRGRVEHRRGRPHERAARSSRGGAGSPCGCPPPCRAWRPAGSRTGSGAATGRRARGPRRGGRPRSRREWRARPRGRGSRSWRRRPRGRAPRRSSTPPSPPKIATRSPKRARSRVILGRVGGSSSLTAWICAISAQSCAMKGAGMFTWVVTGSSCSTIGRPVAAATTRKYSATTSRFLSPRAAPP